MIKDVHPLSRRHFGLLLFATDGGKGVYNFKEAKEYARASDFKLDS